MSIIKSPKSASLLLLLLATATAAAAAFSSGLRSIKQTKDNDNDDANCVYTVFIRTGNIWKGGTDSNISLSLAGSDGLGVAINNLEDWGGLMGAGYNYFERGNLDIFSGRGPCLTSPPCWLNLTSDGSGAHHGWYCNYVEVTATGPHLGCFQTQFTIEQWLGTDVSPYQLYATRDYCVPVAGGGGRREMGVEV